MKTLIVLFNLKAGISATDYETWANAVDIPTVKGLQSIADFKLYKSQMLFGSDAPPPYQYFEIIDIQDLDVFGAEVGTEIMKRVAGEFQQFADGPLFVLTERCG
jgi:REDY-like protein HapK